MHKGLLFSTSSPSLVIPCLFDKSHSNRCEVISHCTLDCISLICDVKHLFMYVIATCMSSLAKWLVRSSAHFLMGLGFFLLLSCMTSLYIMDSNPLLELLFANIFFYFPISLVVFLFCWQFLLLCKQLTQYKIHKHISVGMIIPYILFQREVYN